MPEPGYSRPPLRAGPLKLGDETISCTTYTTPFLSIPSAHGDRASLLAFGSHTSIDAEKGHITRHSKVSVTALSFLSPDRSHMVVTGCDPSASIRVWDIRGRYNRRSGGSPIPVSATTMPSSHATPRAFGLTSISMNSTGSRLYAVGRDSIVYAYSTAHLILGHAPELDLPQSSSLSRPSLGRTGLGPLYGFRNRSLQVGSFYVRASVRFASCGKPEMIAVGSTSASPVLFPTDERDFMDRDRRKRRQPRDIGTANSQAAMYIDLDCELQMDPSGPRRTPIYELGTPLTNGHEKEVSALAWTSEGNLISSGDDRVSRCWREDGYRARDCRRKGLRDGEVARSGWAAVEDSDDDT
jgi:WD40 repeat protein